MTDPSYTHAEIIKAFDHALKVGAPGLSHDVRCAIINNAIIRLDTGEAWRDTLVSENSH